MFMTERDEKCEEGKTQTNQEIDRKRERERGSRQAIYTRSDRQRH